ncbi:MAG: imidazole glycerol phosphate synthase subunit HisF [Candidatus Caldatribacteriota bacterium]|nr:imidazole glycerol phosphate synthase subunit HisF [Candidatus Caldatribacteriota bacterium]
MFTKRIIPCLDIKKGRVVKGIKFVNLIDAGDPVELASFYEKEGADELVFLDIAASYEKRNIIIELVKKTVEKVSIPFTVGGGIKNLEDISQVLRAGADKISINTAAVTNPLLIQEASLKFGSSTIVVAVDAVKVDSDWEVVINGGRTRTGLRILDWAKKMEKLGAGEILLTSKDKDGTKEGYDIELTKMVSENVNIPIIASGGAGKPEDLYEVLVEGKADAALAASIFHKKEYSIAKVKEFLKQRGVEVRLSRDEIKGEKNNE